ncbi:YcaO-like family protein [Actinomadura sp. NPDC000600]|uniref:YcaO-like family protein n=1 Tax=Actinomadura sp. NPDC000600 TaxID=3154262 RepID=UPI003392E525
MTRTRPSCPHPGGVGDRERSVPVAEALALALDAARAHGLHLAWSPPDDTLDDRVTVFTAVLSDAAGSPVGKATGKGVGRRSLASALFEAFEHAAAYGTLPGIPGGLGREVLPPSPFQQFDLLYDHARGVRTAAPQATAEFRTLTGLYPARAGRRVAYPRAVTDLAYHCGDDEADLAVLQRYTTTNGYAAGATLDDALVHAVNELVERDAFSQYLLSSVLGPPRPLPRIEGGAPGPLRRALETVQAEAGTEATVVDITAHTGCVVMAHLVPPEGPSGLAGLGCSPFPEIAYERAVTELHQEWTAFTRGVTFADEGGREPADLAPYPLLHRAATVPEPVCGERLRYEEFVRGRGRSGPADGTPVHLLHTLRNRGFEVFWRPVWRHVAGTRDGEHGVHVVQVIAPGLEQFHGVLFCRPLVPTGRLHSPRTCALLLQRERLEGERG